MTTDNLPVLADSFKEAAPHLRRPFTPEAVRFKVQSGNLNSALIVAYIDARLVTERLNAVCPHLWSDRYEAAGKGMICHLTIDGITRSDYGDGYVGKGLFSDAFKRAAVKFGVGVSLYSVPSTWLNSGPHIKDRKGKPEITPAGVMMLRKQYGAWLENVGIKAFGESLDHGDTADSAGDLDAQVTPADVAAEGEPTEDQREEVKALVKKLGLKGDEKDLVFGSHGVQSGVASTFAQVASLIDDLKARAAR